MKSFDLPSECRSLIAVGWVCFGIGAVGLVVAGVMGSELIILAALLLWSLSALPWGMAVRRSRNVWQMRLDGYCGQCGYDLRDTLQAGRDECPECGYTLEATDEATGKTIHDA